MSDPAFAAYRARDLHKATHASAQNWLKREIDAASTGSAGLTRTLVGVQETKAGLRRLHDGLGQLSAQVGASRIVALRLAAPKAAEPY
jgi:uncharacterized phage infection (PIP) family protein YhgE